MGRRNKQETEEPQPPEVPAETPLQGDIELVADPGPVKRIVFEGTEPPAAAKPEPQAEVPEREFRRVEPGLGNPRPLVESASIHTIREEVDRIHAPDPSFHGTPPRANLRSWRSSTVYRTDHGGEVRAYEGPTGRTLTLADGDRERRFTEADVDRVIANVSLGESTPTAQAEPEVQEEEAAPEARPKRRGLFGFRRKGKEEQEPAKEEASEYQPQCSALTEEGLQCRNSARGGSKYCSSHYGYQPRTVQGIHQSRDTEPRFESSRDTLPGGWDPGREGSHQCGAVTREGSQCMNPVVAGSPYCGSHQSYSEPKESDIIGSVDTKPRWAKAKDTKPSARKAKKARKSR